MFGCWVGSRETKALRVGTKACPKHRLFSSADSTTLRAALANCSGGVSLYNTFEFDIIHVLGHENVVADILPRCSLYHNKRMVGVKSVIVSLTIFLFCFHKLMFILLVTGV